MSSQIPNYCGSNIIQYLNDKFTYQVKSDFQAELIALDNAVAKAQTILAGAVRPRGPFDDFLDGLRDTSWRDVFKAAGMTDDSLKIRNRPYTGGYVGVKLQDGRIFTEPATGADRERAAAAFARIVKLCETLSVDMLDLIGPSKPDEDADYADPRVNYSAAVCYCDSDHPMYCDPPVWTDNPRCCGGGGNPKLKDGIHNGGHEWNCPVIRCPRHYI